MTYHANNGNLLDKQSAAKRLAISPRTLDYRIKQGLIPYVKIGKLVRFIPIDLDKFIQAHRVGR